MTPEESEGTAATNPMQLDSGAGSAAPASDQRAGAAGPLPGPKTGHLWLLCCVHGDGTESKTMRRKQGKALPKTEDAEPNSGAGNTRKGI